MKSSELLELLEYIGPLSLSQQFCKRFDAYDNSGIIVDSGDDIAGVLFSLDLSSAAIAEAEARGFNAIVTHHPAIFGGIERLSPSEGKSSLVAECLLKHITVISMHLNFDAAPEGIDYYLMRGLGGDAADVCYKLDGGGYGRVYDVKRRKLGDYAGFIKKNFSSDRVLVYGDPERVVSRVASFCGAGCDDGAIEFAVRSSADVFVSSDIKHHHIAALKERGMSVIILTHYAAENYGFNQIYKKLIEELNVSAAYFCDAELM